MWPFWYRFVAVLVCGRLAVFICVSFGCGHFGLWPFWMAPSEIQQDTGQNQIDFYLSYLPLASPDEGYTIRTSLRSMTSEN